MTPAAEITGRLAAIRERCAKATPGPWEFGETEGMDCTWMDVFAVSTDDDILSGETRPRTHIVHPDYQHIETHGKQQAIADLECTAHARDDIPWLLKQLELMRDLAMQRGIMLDEARANLAEARAQCAAMREALEPFAKWSAKIRGLNNLGDSCPLMADPTEVYEAGDVTVADLRKAAAALESKP